MKKIYLIISVILFPFLINANTHHRVQQDTVQHFSSLSEVSDTVPNVDFFGNNTPLKITLKYDITSFIRHKMKGEYIDAELTVSYLNIPPVTKNVRLKARGNFRRGQCYFPPIYLNFKTDPIKNTELKGAKKIKIVTHCSPSKNNDIYILREYLAYKLFNVLSDESFRVRLLDITYIDTGKKQKSYQNYGFIIEPVELVAQRNNSIEVDGVFVKEENIIEKRADKVALFEYMIGNTDWRFKSGHNMKYLKSMTDANPKVIAVPYDFDFSGFVDAHYAFPQEWTKLNDVRTREYLGYCRNSDDDYMETMRFFLEKKEQILKSINTFEYISEKDKKYLTRYINEFYNSLSRPKTFISTLKEQCRTNF